MKILHTDRHLIVVDKPATMPVYPLREGEGGTIAELLEQRFPEQASVGPPRQAGIIHRLDNTTSGILVAARDNETYKKMRALWNGPSVTKTYTALVLGKLGRTRKITTPIAHHPSNKKKMVVCETERRKVEWKGREAKTEVSPKKTFVGDGGSFFSLVSVRITTGVRHQIRVHLASIGHPIVGDRLYQNPQKRKADPINLGRPFLHLTKVSLPHPLTGRPLTIPSPLAQDLAEVLRSLK